MSLLRCPICNKPVHGGQRFVLSIVTEEAVTDHTVVDHMPAHRLPTHLACLTTVRVSESTGDLKGKARLVAQKLLERPNLAAAVMAEIIHALEGGSDPPSPA